MAGGALREISGISQDTGAEKAELNDTPAHTGVGLMGPLLTTLRARSEASASI
jgi:hypothetical protein